MAIVLDSGDIELEQYCIHYHDPNNALESGKSCKFCKDTYMYPTQFGEKVLAFIEKYKDWNKK